MSDVVATATIRRPRLMSAALILSSGAALCVLLTGAMRFIPNAFDSAPAPESAAQAKDRDEEFRKFNMIMVHWASRAHAGGGKVVVTSQEIKDAAALIHDSCR